MTVNALNRDKLKGKSRFSLRNKPLGSFLRNLFL
jgi:hypothetical protein